MLKTCHFERSEKSIRLIWLELYDRRLDNPCRSINAAV